MRFETIREQALNAWTDFDAPGKPRILVGTATCGQAAGAGASLDRIRAYAASRNLADRVWEVGCLGLCYAEPLVELSQPELPRILYAGVLANDVEPLLRGYFERGDLRPDMALATMNGAGAAGIARFADLPMIRSQVRVVLRNSGIISPGNAYHYIARGGYEGLRLALSMSPEQVIEEVQASGLRGRGGAGFPTGTKWELCRKAKGEPKYVVCNADEGDPGAFMDRSVIENDPHSIIEGMCIAAWAIGAEQGYIYARAEYPLAIRRLEQALQQVRDMGLLGSNILGTGFNFQIRIKKGAGAFVCGEETALLASIEGRRGMPHSRPPFPAQEGLSGKPTNINNVETLANIPVIITRGSGWYSRHGTEKSRGTKTFALAGKIARTGLIEVPLGTSLRDIVFTIGGGVPDGRQFKAVQTGGPSGGCLSAEYLDIAVDYENLAEAGAIMGSGGMVVMDDETCMVDVARYFVEFTQRESCGKCAPCRLGTRQMLRILTDICNGRAKREDLDLLEEIAHVVQAASLCGLGQTAPNPVLTTLRYYKDEYEAHVRDHRCPAGQCPGLLRYVIDPEACTGCTACVRKCTVNAIAGKKNQPHVIDQETCITCGACYAVCRFHAVTKV